MASPRITRRNKSPAGLASPPSPPTSASSSAPSTPARPRSPAHSPDAPSTENDAHSPSHRDDSSSSSSSSISRHWQHIYTTYEVPRKTLHSAIGVVSLGLYATPLVTPRGLLQLAIPAAAVIISADLLRFNSPKFAQVYERHLGYLMRPAEKQSWNGVIFYLVGCILVLTFLPADLATLSVLLLSWCDTAASTIGRAVGRYGPQLRRGKSVLGSLAAWVTGTCATALFYTYITPLREATVPSWQADRSSLSLLQVSVLGGLAAAVSEAVDVAGLDDNLTIPVLSGGLLWTILCWMGYGSS